MNELKNRGAQDILIAVVDGLRGFPEAINAVFPQTIVQTCIVGSLNKPAIADSVVASRFAGDWPRCLDARNGINSNFS